MKCHASFSSLLFILMLVAMLFVSNLDAQLPSFITHIPSEAGGEEGIAVKIIPPVASRYPEGAPIAINVQGGVNGIGIKGTGLNIERQGFISLFFNFPGSGAGEERSGGFYDQRGQECLKALRDVIYFALGKLPDQNGKFLADFVDEIHPLASNVGLIGLSNGGNAAISVAGVYGAEIGSLAWIVNFESPVGDGMPTADAGSRGTSWNPSENPAYNPDTGEFDMSLLAFDDTVSANQNSSFQNLGELRGGFYFDINQNGIVDVGKDFIAAPFLYITNDTLKAFYSVRIMEEAENRGLVPENPPTHIPSLEQTREYWHWRNGENWFLQAVQNFPDLMFIVEASETDHVQSAADHPHVLIQYQGFLSAGARFVRLNPDRAYVENILMSSAPTAADNDAFTVYDHQTIRSALEPPRQGGYQISTTVVAAACELADRTQWNNLEPQIDKVLTSVDDTNTKVPNDYHLFRVYPNPVSSLANIEFQIYPEISSINESVNLSIYNILGEKLATLYDGNANSGKLILEFNSKGFASGIYFIKLTSSSFCSTKAIRIIK